MVCRELVITSNVIVTTSKGKYVCVRACVCVCVWGGGGGGAILAVGRTLYSTMNILERWGLACLMDGPNFNSHAPLQVWVEQILQEGHHKQHHHILNARHHI